MKVGDTVVATSGAFDFVLSDTLSTRNREMVGVHRSGGKPTGALASRDVGTFRVVAVNRAPTSRSSIEWRAGAGNQRGPDRSSKTNIAREAGRQADAIKYPGPVRGHQKRTDQRASGATPGRRSARVVHGTARDEIVCRPVPGGLHFQY